MTDDLSPLAAPDLTDADRASLEFIPVILAALGLEILPGGSEVAALSEEEVEAGARLEHLRWCRYTRRSGVGDHPDLVAYDELDEASREKDRARVREIPSLLRGAGLGLHRR